jgi:hypothetical protein
MMYEYEFSVWGARFYVTETSLASARLRLPEMVIEVHGQVPASDKGMRLPLSVREVPWMPTPG